MSDARPVFRFAPSPNGRLHLGHALSAILNHDMAKSMGGRFLLRIEDIDPARSNAGFEAGILEDLAWLGLIWEEPVRRQSDHLDDYRAALARLGDLGLVYPSFSSRGEVRAMVRAAGDRGEIWPCDPDGTPLFPDRDRLRDRRDVRDLIASGARHALRLDMTRAMARLSRPLAFRETGEGLDRDVAADPAAWGDVVLWRSDAPSSYHLSVVVDDGIQGVTHVVRGRDLLASTSVHRLLQDILGLPAPIYHHHRLIMGPDGRKLSKSLASTGLATLRADGATPSDIRRLVGL